MSTTPLGVTFGSLSVLGAGAAPEIAATAQQLGYKSFWSVEATATDGPPRDFQSAVAVTGSGGYIGSHIVLNLIQQGDWSVSDSDRPVIILGLVRGSLEPAPGVN
jgi:hypothetical protein